MWVASILFFIAPWVHFWLGSNIIMLAFCAIMLGAGTFIIYPISVSHVNDLIDDEDRVNASGMMIMLQSIGMICGPIVISYFMGIFGPIAFALAYSITAAGFVVFALKHISFKPDVGYKNITPTAPMPIDTTHAFHELATYDKLSTFAKIRQALIQRIRR